MDCGRKEGVVYLLGSSFKQGIYRKGGEKPIAGCRPGRITGFLEYRNERWDGIDLCVQVFLHVCTSYLERKAVFDFDFEAAKLLIYMQCKAMHALEGGGGGGGRGGQTGLPAPVTFLNNLISLIKRELNEKRAVITLVIEKLNVQIDCLFILSHCKLWHQRRRCMLSHDRSQIQLLLYQIWNKKQKQNAENLRHKNTVKQCVLEISFKLGNFAS